MTETVKFEVPDYIVERWVKAAARAWEPEEYDENYISSVSCGNSDDSFADGDVQGAAAAYDDILSYEVK